MDYNSDDLSILRQLGIRTDDSKGIPEPLSSYLDRKQEQDLAKCEAIRRVTKPPVEGSFWLGVRNALLILAGIALVVYLAVWR